MTRAERRAAEKARKEAAKLKHAGPIVSDDDGSDAEPTAPSVPSMKTLEKGVAGIRVSNPNDPRNASSEPSRREREAMAAAAAKERYWKLQQEGKTDQAKADLARLAEIRREREEKAAMRKAGKFVMDMGAYEEIANCSPRAGREEEAGRRKGEPTCWKREEVKVILYGFLPAFVLLLSTAILRCIAC